MDPTGATLKTLNASNLLWFLRSSDPATGETKQQICFFVDFFVTKSSYGFFPGRMLCSRGEFQQKTATSFLPSLVGGWTNPSEKYARQIGSSPPGFGMKIKNTWVANHLVQLYLPAEWVYNPKELESERNLPLMAPDGPQGVISRKFPDGQFLKKPSKIRHKFRQIIISRGSYPV